MSDRWQHAFTIRHGHMHAPPPPVIDLTRCSKCPGVLVFPEKWKELDNDQWYLKRRCPDCEHRSTGVYDHSVVDAYDEQLNRGTGIIIDQMEWVSKHNFREYIARFKNALDQDALLPEDF